MELIAKTFPELSAEELYEILKARAEVFIMEQNILYQDMDDIDYHSLHCFFREKGIVTAYLRAYRTDENSDAVKVGRVLTLHHGQGTGRELMKKSIPVIAERMKFGRMYMDAQKHAVGFYEKLGFTVTSGDFMEAGIVHVSMELRVPNADK